MPHRGVGWSGVQCSTTIQLHVKEESSSLRKVNPNILCTQACLGMARHRYTRSDTEMGEEEDETGWKYLHGDVFRFPPHISLFSAMMGVGTQVCAAVWWWIASAGGVIVKGVGAWA